MFEKAKFTVLIESSISFPEQGWEVVLWHNCHGNGHWDALSLHEVDQSSEGAPVSRSVSASVRLFIFATHSWLSHPRVVQKSTDDTLPVSFQGSAMAQHLSNLR